MKKDDAPTVNAIEIVAENADFLKFKNMSDYLGSLNGVSKMEKSMSDNIAQIFIRCKEDVEEIAMHLMQAEKIKVEITGFSEN